MKLIPIPHPASVVRKAAAIALSLLPLVPASSLAASPVTLLGADSYKSGLSGRNIALWNSHGAYYNDDKNQWIFQRAPLNTTVEDVYTSTYILDLVAPMLENSGAYVMIPRERDTSTVEVIADADSQSTPGYSESGSWAKVAVGYRFHDGVLRQGDNPMTEGSARSANAVPLNSASAPVATWSLDIPSPGTYSLYVTYPKAANPTSAARYTVNSLRGAETYIVDQSMGAGTWVRLGEFPFDSSVAPASVTLTAASGDNAGKIVLADAVRVGGGIGNVARGKDDLTSLRPRWAEAARYWLQYAGFPEEVYSPEESETDYNADIRCRPNWVNHLTGGSPRNPRAKGLNIPVDLALALHTDAGITPDTTIVGTLGIYCTDGGSRLGDGRRRTTSRLLTESVVNSIVNDIRALHQPGWTKRKLRDRRYIEARYPVVPSALIELLSHQNYADMTLGLDPQFRFDVSRAIYKGILRYLYSESSREPVVQPLPVRSFAIEILPSGMLRLSWLPTDDPLEPSAAPSGYVIERRDGLSGGFRPIATTSRTSIDLPAEPDVDASFRVIATNDGGRSFPSEVLSAAVFDNDRPPLLIVNGFTRISAPERFDTGTEAGFLDGIDFGVPYIRNVGYIGSQYDFDRASEWTSDDLHPGHGASYTDNAGKPVAGNTFDYPAVHGSALARNRQTYTSASLDGYLRLDSVGAWHMPVIDLILGKQHESTRGNTDPSTRFKPFPAPLQAALTRHLSSDGRLIVSGTHIATDLLANSFSNDSTTVADRRFARDVLGIDLLESFVGVTGQVDLSPWWANDHRASTATHPALPNPRMYHVESPDAISSTREGAFTIARYRAGNHPAGIVIPAAEGKGAVVAYGFPLETIEQPDLLSQSLEAALLYILPWKLPMAPRFDIPLPSIDPIPVADPSTPPPSSI